MRAAIPVCVFCAVLIASPASAQTTVPGGTVVDQTWTPAGSPYTVEGDITVPAGAFLVIEAGTVVRMTTTDSQYGGRDPNRVEVTIHGTLSVAGTEASPVTFESSSGTTAASWYGIVIANDASAATVGGSLVRHAYFGVYSEAPGTVLQVTQVTIETSTYGIYLLAGSPLLDRVELRGMSVTGLYAGGSSGPSISGSIVRSNADEGIHVYTTSGAATVAVSGCTLHGNGLAGLRVEAWAGATATVNLKNSNVTMNGTGVYRAFGTGTSVVNTTYSNVWRNTTNFSNAVAGTGSLSANPLYAGEPANLRLTSRSPSRFAADLGGDIGALPFAGDLTPGLHGTHWESSTLTLAASPYSVAGDLTVAPGAVLTIEPGATLSFATSDVMASGSDTTRAELRVGGVLQALGSAGSPITFTSDGSGANSWYGIVLLAAATGSVIEHARVDEAWHAIEHLSAGGHTLRYLTLTGSGTGLYATRGTLALDAVTSSGNAIDGVLLNGSAGGSVTNSVLSGNGGTGLDFEVMGAVTAQLAVESSTVFGNSAVGIRVRTWSSGSRADLTVQNSIVTNNAYYGVRRESGMGIATAAVLYSDVWNNSPGNYSDVSAGAGSISENPQYASPPADLSLQSTSVCIDSGTASGAPDHDVLGTLRPLDGNGVGGAQGDMGAYEYVRGDGAVTIAVADANALEGDDTPVSLGFEVTLSAPTPRAVSVSWATTAGGTATAGADFTPGGGVISFSPNTTTASAAVPVAGDLLDEEDETVIVQLSAPSGATIADGEGNGLILDNDPLPALAASDAVVCEGTTAIVPLDLDAPSGLEVTVDFHTVAGTAEAGADFVEDGGLVSIPAQHGAWGVAISTLGDGELEPDETFSVHFENAVHALLLTPAATVTVHDRSSGLCVIFADNFESGALPGGWSARLP